eukprot:TRINITY_DN42324_c0_g1_i2.p1 TRINITY_DN42324_c0_g1~~TRINITY_DN42324_c0_g1_i2.p1  ORF type:complete len:140 (+),score=32.25 TRINITY_DN42324_c0_g1_i2:199-618(+)
MLRMVPARHGGNPKLAMPDLAIAFGEEQTADVAALQPGDWVKFDATMLEHRRREEADIMLLRSIAVVGSLVEANETVWEDLMVDSDSATTKSGFKLSWQLLDDIWLQIEVVILALLAMPVAWTGYMYCKEEYFDNGLTL